jgi:hypothetical protein
MRKKCKNARLSPRFLGNEGKQQLALQTERSYLIPLRLGITEQLCRRLWTRSETLQAISMPTLISTQSKTRNKQVK